MEESAVVVRRTEAGDVAAIVALSDDLFHEDAARRDPTVNLNWAREEGAAYYHALLHGAGGFGFVAEAGGEALGYLVGRLHDASAYRPLVSAELESMFVVAPWRGRGLGARLVAAFLALAAEHGAGRATVSAFWGNERAIAFYRRMGFAPQSLTLERREAAQSSK